MGNYYIHHCLRQRTWATESLTSVHRPNTTVRPQYSSLVLWFLDTYSQLEGLSVQFVLVANAFLPVKSDSYDIAGKIADSDENLYPTQLLKLADSSFNSNHHIFNKKKIFERINPATYLYLSRIFCHQPLLLSSLLFRPDQLFMLFQLGELLKIPV